MAKITKKIKEEAQDEGMEVLGSFLKSEKAFHYNFEESVTYCVSTGSLLLDSELEGFGPGFHRFVGPTESGKTSMALEVMKNMLKTVKGSKGFFIKAEGRLSEKMQKRSGIKFVFSAEEWVVGTCFVFESNVYETAMAAIRNLITKNKNKYKYCFVVDSSDGLLPKVDLERDFEDANKVAGGAVIASTFAKRASLALSKRGHMAIWLSQVRAEVKINPHAAGNKQKTSVSTGGNALMHYPDFIIEFCTPYQGDRITKTGDKTVSSDKNPIIGHNAKIIIKKSPNEKTEMSYSYPIKYGRVGGRSIWLEREVIDFCLMWEFIERRGAWFSFSEEFTELTKDEEGFPEKVQGLDGVYKEVESRPALVDKLFKFCKDQIISARPK
mgnify:CR=1 FL=1